LSCPLILELFTVIFSNLLCAYPIIPPVYLLFPVIFISFAFVFNISPVPSPTNPPTLIFPLTVTFSIIILSITAVLYPTIPTLVDFSATIVISENSVLSMFPLSVPIIPTFDVLLSKFILIFSNLTSLNFVVISFISPFSVPLNVKSIFFNVFVPPTASNLAIVTLEFIFVLPEKSIFDINL